MNVVRCASGSTRAPGTELKTEHDALAERLAVRRLMRAEDVEFARMKELRGRLELDP
jgi:hypothetical protein